MPFFTAKGIEITSKEDDTNFSRESGEKSSARWIGVSMSDDKTTSYLRQDSLIKQKERKRFESSMPIVAEQGEEDDE